MRIAYEYAIDWFQLKFEEYIRKCSNGEVLHYVVPYADGRMWSSRTRVVYPNTDYTITDASMGDPAAVFTHIDGKPYILLCPKGDTNSYEPVLGLWNEEVIGEVADIHVDESINTQYLITTAVVDLRRSGFKYVVYGDMTSKPVIYANDEIEYASRVMTMGFGDHIVICLTGVIDVEIKVMKKRDTDER